MSFGRSWGWNVSSAALLCGLVLGGTAFGGEDEAPSSERKNIPGVARGAAEPLIPPPEVSGPSNLDRGIALAQNTGHPLFVMLTREACGNCAALKRRIATDAQLQAALTQYVVVEVDVDGPESSVWRRRYQNAGNMLPLLYLVAATGHEISTASGYQKGDALPKQLMEGLVQAAQINAAAGFKPQSEKVARTSKRGKAAGAAADKAPEASADDADSTSDEAAVTERPSKPQPTIGLRRKTTPEMRANSNLKIAQTFAATRPEKAKEYAQKVLAEVAADSPQAVAAKELLESLD